MIATVAFLGMLMACNVVAAGTTTDQCKAVGGDRKEWACAACNAYTTGGIGANTVADGCRTCLKVSPLLPASSCTHSCAGAVNQSSPGAYAVMNGCTSCLAATQQSKQWLCANCITVSAKLTAGNSNAKAAIRDKCFSCVRGINGWSKVNDWQCQDVDGLTVAAAGDYLDCLKGLSLDKLGLAWVCKTCPAGKGASCGACLKKADTDAGNAWQCVKAPFRNAGRKQL